MTGHGFTLIELFVQGYRPGSPCEDMVAVVGPFAAVLDGVTSKDRSVYRGTTGGRFAAEVVLSALETLDPDVSARECVDAVTRALADAIVAERGAPVPHPPGTQLAVYSPYRRELWQVGDVRARVAGVELPLYPPPTDEVAGGFRAALLSALLREGVTVEELAAADPARDAILPLLAHQDAFANLPDPHRYGYGVINGAAVPDHHLRITPVPAGSEVVLATDGYLSAAGSLADAERHLAAYVETDPLMIGEHLGLRPAGASGSFDDRAWLRLRTR
jgi:hypothetical protein